MSNLLPHAAWPSQVERCGGRCFYSVPIDGVRILSGASGKS